MNSRHSTKSWTIKLPNGWTVGEDDEITTITAVPEIGALQITSIVKEQGDVTPDDLAEFANQKVGLGVTQKRFGDFKGMGVSYVEEEVFWEELWLCHANTLLYITYNVDLKDKDRETEAVDEILSSLRAIPQRDTETA